MAEQPPATLCTAALIVENLTPQADFDVERFIPFSHHAGRALSLAAELEDTPLIGLGRRLKRLWSRRMFYLSRTAMIGLLVTAAIISSLLIPADLIIQAKGRFYPSQLQHIYAPLAGEVISIKESRQPVSAGDKLVVIRSRQWELKKEEILTQRGVTLEKLRGVESARLNNRRPSNQEASPQPTDLSATERELRELLTSQDQQLSIVQKMLDSLSITSPIAGTIISWNPLESWENRPVQQGQKLLSIAAEEGVGWLHLRVRDSDVRHLLSHTEGSASNISFSIASDPGERFAATLTELGSITETMPGEPPSVRLTARVQPSDKLNARHGATVQARIHCGQRSLAYVWTRRLWEYVLMNW